RRRVAAAAGEPLPRGAARRGPAAPREAPGAAGLQHLPAVSRLRRRRPSPQGLVERFVTEGAGVSATLSWLPADRGAVGRPHGLRCVLAGQVYLRGGHEADADNGVVVAPLRPLSQGVPGLSGSWVMTTRQYGAAIDSALLQALRESIRGGHGENRLRHRPSMAGCARDQTPSCWGSARIRAAESWPHDNHRAEQD